MTARIVALTGIAGVGKSTLVTALGASIRLEHLKASKLIQEGRDASDVTVSHDALRLANLDENQRFLIQGIAVKTNSRRALFVLDGHTAIERVDGLTLIEPDVLRKLVSGV
jgi:adenylate kinase